ncbi:ketopantoate reductase family protein [Cohnella silvisoli]|uniref:2-dehydropantoate 2-reductase n=1 Tax=Cohnella silvisoli TaxID=2873699 RepID=A0ABV1KYR4_9BACL|nr:2-dehydropantoate 2-reductase [Cohnella silvisoli]MCD9024449.1 2-dehydropantoate 2-reductase [Cohnella silvisoli]
MFMDKIAVLGGGSLGMLLAGKLTASGCDCVLWTRTRSQASLLNGNGLKLEDQSGDRLIKVKAVPFEDASAGEHGFVLVAVKQTALVPELQGKLAATIPVGGTLVLFQNGIGHFELLQRVLPGRKLIMAVTTEGALRIDSTTVRHTGRGETRIGDGHPEGIAELADTGNEPFSDELLHLERLLKQAGFSVYLSKQLGDAILRKLLINAVINPLTAILRIRNGQLTESSARLELMRSLFQETFEIVKDYGVGEETELWNAILQVCSATRDNESSMLQDVSAHKETEIEFINGVICRLAKEQGKEAPWNEAVMALVKAAH